MPLRRPAGKLPTSRFDTATMPACLTQRMSRRFPTIPSLSRHFLAGLALAVAAAQVVRAAPTAGFVEGEVIVTYRPTASLAIAQAGFFPAGDFTLTFPSVSGITSATLAPDSWTAFGPDLTGTGGILQATDAAPKPANRFDRIRVIP